MKLLIQRVNSGSVSVGEQLVSQIGKGLVVLLGIHEKDNHETAKKLAQKLPKIRLWSQGEKKWHLSAQDLDYEILIVSQFTLYAYMKGNKPDFHYSMGAEQANELYAYFIEEVKKVYKPEKIKMGAFQQYMSVKIDNDGPVTIEIDDFIESKQQKQKQDIPQQQEQKDIPQQQQQQQQQEQK